MSRVTRGEKILESLVKNPRSSLTEAGKQAVIIMLDPFHDDQIHPLEGYPDMEVAPSIVRCIKTTRSVSARSGGGAALTEPWDLHITLWPFLNPQSFLDCDGRLNNILEFSSADATGSSNAVGGLQMQRVTTTGADVDFFPPAGDANSLGCLVPDPNFLNGVHRVIGIGYEVYDTTSELNKQGDVTVYQQTQAPKDPQEFSAVNLHNFAPVIIDASLDFTGTMFRHPPKNTNQAILMPGSKAWNARDGVYQVARFHSTDNPSYAADYDCPVIFDSPQDMDRMYEYDSGTVNNSSVHCAAANGAVDRQFVLGAASLFRRRYAARPQHLYPYHNSGCIFSGLHPLATFKVCMNLYIETFPGIDESSLLPLATPSAAYDPMALEVISHCLSRLPVAVPVGQNPLGEWFASAVTKASEFVSPMLLKSGNPTAMAAGGALQLVTPLMQSRREYKAEQYPQQVAVLAIKKKKKRTKRKNAQMSVGNRGKKGLIQGPVREGIIDRAHR